MSDDSRTSDVEHADIECFAALPNDTAQATGLTENVVRKTIRENQGTTDVVKYLRFTNVPPAVADKFSRCNTRQMFNPSTRYMIIKLLSGAHETAARGLDGAMGHDIYNMGLGKAIRPLGSKTIHGVFCRKEADAAYGPAQPVPGRSPKWPTVVVEVGVSESYRKLRADADWWLTNSKGDVKLVVLVSISRTTPNVRFETVALNPTVDSLRLQRPRYAPYIRQTITASRNANEPNSQISIRPSVPLTIPFEELLCHPPVPPEGDIQISPHRLEEISEHVWAEQGL
ncbi:uncharacterized protein N7515_005585 [Penicillium bovifimosum]|uniref:Uncharacterized protein n=1 Tax=Penicillium bovifimosum TaxID=126998 RepID=A0A9W9KZY9_9EURO|nr:uncharacterized protein N7515_005585 [Penicillium bovifimosum]KAJ5129546.1 hypothetical protein N7515_005585 [Penicillium bovifimosum]